MADDWHKFFEHAWTKAEGQDKSGLDGLLDSMKRSLVEAVEDMTNQGVREQDAVLWILDLADASNGPIRLLESWAMELWPDVFWEEEEDE